MMNHSEQDYLFNDPDYLSGRELMGQKRYTEATEMFERALLRDPAHGPTIIELIDTLYCAGQSCIFQEEEHGLRNESTSEPVKEFREAERIARYYLQVDFGEDNNRILRLRIWVILAKISSFMGNYDDAFKRLETAQAIDPDYERPAELLMELRQQLAERRGIPFPIPFPEPGRFATSPPIAFPFTASIDWGDGSIHFPPDVSQEWRRLWIIDHNIGQLERFDDGDGAQEMLSRSIRMLERFTSTDLAALAVRRIAGAVFKLGLTSGQIAMLVGVARETFTGLKETVSVEMLCTSWNAVATDTAFSL